MRRYRIKAEDARRGPGEGEGRVQEAGFRVQELRKAESRRQKAEGRNYQGPSTSRDHHQALVESAGDPEDSAASGARGGWVNEALERDEVLTD
jgi:hypothetical protein